MMLSLLAAVLAALTAAAPAQDLVGVLDEQVAAARSLDVEEIVTRAAALRDLAEDTALEDGSALVALERALAQRLRSPGQPEPRGVVFLAACLLQGDEPDVDAAARALLPLLDDPAQELARAAAELLGAPAFKRGLDPDLQEQRLAALLGAAKDPDRAPELRLGCAQSAYRTGGGAERRQARAEMLAFLDSGDPHLRKLGALALGRIGEVVRSKLRTELTRIAALPGTEGALAESYLQQEELQKLHERKFENLLESYTKKELPEDLAELDSVMRLIETQHLDGDKVTREELVAAGANGMLRMLDEHSAYLSPDFYKRFQQDLDAEYGGIGAYVEVDPEDELFTITRPIYSGPAYRAGLQSDDKIVRIDDWPTLRENRDDIIKRLKGKPGTSVRLYVWRRSMDPALIERPTEDMVVEIERALIEIPALADQLLPGGIGLVDLQEFSKVTTRELRASVKDMVDAGMRALVLDLRRNSGGLLTEARSVADLFLPRGPLTVVSTESREGPVETLTTRGNAVLPEDVPVIVLTSRFTASAAEIVTGALQDHGRGVVVGDRSFGKGSVQQLIPLPGARDDEFQDVNGNGRWDDWEPITQDWNANGEYDYAPRVKLTIARYVLPSGRSIHRELDRDKNIVSEGGVEPDVRVAMPRTEPWKFEERLRLQDQGVARDWVDARWETDRELLRALAVYDGKDPSRYPGFDELVAGLETRLGRDDLRQLLRREVRRRVQDERGAEFPGFDIQGDFQEDPQLQEAIRIALERLGGSPADVPEYAATFAPAEDAGSEVATLLPDEIASARATLERARDGDGRVPREAIEHLLSLLEELQEN